MIRVCAISDIHNKLSQVKIPDCDVLLIAGDLTGMGTRPELSKFNHDLIKIKQRGIIVVCVAGNHDFLFEQQSEYAKSLIPNVKHYLDDSSVTVNGIKIHGSAWTPWFYDWAFNAQRGADIKKHWDLVPQDTDILITHGPPYGILDKTPQGEKVGCQDLLDAVLRIKPQYHIFGHIHHSYGEANFNGTMFINASTCDERYMPVNPPIIFDI